MARPPEARAEADAPVTEGMPPSRDAAETSTPTLGEQPSGSGSPSEGGVVPVKRRAEEDLRLALARGRRRALARRVLGRVGFVALMVLLAGVAALSQTGEGQALVLDAALDRVRGALAGELRVGGIRSGTLLTGATLTDVTLTAEDGRPFLRADSVVLRYSLPLIFAGAPPIRSTVLWGAEIEVSRYSDDQELNVLGLLAERPPDSTATSAPRPTNLGRIGIRDGSFRLVTPARPGTATPTLVDEQGRRLQQIAFDGLDLDLESTLLRPGGSVALEASLASFSAAISLVEDPLVVRQVFGDLTFGAQGIRIRDAAFRLPSTLLRGELAIGPERQGQPWTVRADLSVDGWGDLADLRWTDARIPPGRFRGSATVRVPDAVEVDVRGFDVELEASSLTADGWIRFGDPVSLRGMEVTVSPLTVERLEPWLDTEFPLDGWLSGQATFSGTLRDLNATGRMTLVPTGYGGLPTIANFNGTFHRGPNPGASGLELSFDSLNYAILSAFWPEARVGGSGRGRLEVQGRANDGLTLVGDFSHLADSASVSRLAARGLARRLPDGTWTTDLRGELIPLSLGALTRLAPDLGLRGTLAGEVRVSGRFSDLSVTGDLVTEGGGVFVDGSFDLGSREAPYRLEVRAEGLPLSSLSTGLPEESAWTGRLLLEGRGLDLASMESRGTLIARDSRVGSVRVDTAAAALRISRGVLITDTLDATVGGLEIDGRGRFGLAEGSWGSSSFVFEGETLAGLRPLLMGVSDSVLVRDDLGELDRQFLRASGVDPDTLPSEADVRLRGQVRGAASLSGEIRAFDLGLLVDLADAAYRLNEVDTARIALTATGLPSTGGTWGVGMTARGVVWQGRSFQQGGFEAGMTGRAGSGRIELVRTADEQYRAAGSFRLGEGEGEVGLERGQIQIGGDVWNLTRPARIAWSVGSLELDSLSVERLGDDPMSLTAHGVVTRGGQSDFRLDLRGFHVERLAHIAQLDLEIGGHVDLQVDVSGPSESPSIGGEFRIEGPRYGAMQLSRLDGSLDYADQTAVFGLRGYDGVRNAIVASGRLPLDLSLAGVERRVLDRPMDVAITADSLDAAIGLSYLSSLEQVIGTVSGEVFVGGTPEAPAPEGMLTLSNAEWSVEAIGVRHTGVSGSLTLNPDRTVDVALVSTGVGRSEVGGTVLLTPFRDPPLDLTFRFERFPAVDRVDVEGLISGSFDLQGSYRRPLATGSLTVDESTIYVDEFQRAAGVVDLSDPMLFEQGLGVDTTALLAQPLVAGLRNPFFDNLRVNIDLAVPRDTWLRSIDTNVEMGGDLVVAYDRSAADLVLIGELQALRGSHRVLGRNFDLDGGTVSFIGRPGLNPDLDIQATTQIRRRQLPDLEVQADVSGTLIRPVVTLSTEERGIGEADLVSYLIFGQPTAVLASSQSEVTGQVGSAAISSLRSGGLTYLGGTLANQFTAALAQRTDLVDYLSVRLNDAGGFNQLGRTQFEAGRYLGRDVFAVLVFQLSSENESSNLVGGARVEWSVMDDYIVEGFFEDRFLRAGASGFALPNVLDGDRVLGVFIFRDWGY